MKVIITTVGTSLFSNLLNKNYDKYFGYEIDSDQLREEIRKGTAKIDDLKNIEIDNFIKGKIKSKYENQQKAKEAVLFDDNYPSLNLNASAEIKSICKIANGESAVVYLLATDTDISEYAAEKIKEALDGKNNLEFKEIKRIEGLKIDDPEKFEEIGFSKLIEEIDKIYKEPPNIILNISGGYKALIPFLTIYGQLRQIPLNYIYEDSEKIIEIKNNFIGFNYTTLDILYPFMDNEFYEKEDKNDEENKIIEELKKRGLVKVDENNKIKETEIGYLFKSIYDKYSENSKKPFSFLVEFKLWEYYNKHKLNNFKYEVKHECILKHKEINNNNPEKPDLCFYLNGKLNIIGEIKSFGEAKQDKVKKSAIRRIKIAQKKKLPIEKYILFIYKAPFHKIENLKHQLKNIKQAIKDETNFDNFEIMFFDIKTYQNEYNYNFQGFLQSDKLEIKELDL